MYNMNMSKKFIFLVPVVAVSLFLIAFFFVNTASAQITLQNPGFITPNTVTNPGLVNPLCPPTDPNCSRSDVEGLLNSIIDWLLRIATPIAVGMILVGAFQIMFAGGDEEKFKRGRNTILYTAIGYAIILIGRGITLIIQDFLSH